MPDTSSLTNSLRGGLSYVLPNSPLLPGDKQQQSLPDPLGAYPSTWGEFDVDPAEVQAERRFGAGAAGAIGNALSQLWNFIKVPGEVYEGKYTPEEMRRMGPGYALGLMGLGTPVGLGTVPENSLGIFAGTKALTTSPGDIERAMLLERLNLSPEHINTLTGMFRGPEGGWRRTISDEPARLKLEALRQNQFDSSIYNISSKKKLTLGDILEHPALFEAYPELASYNVKAMPLADLESGTRGALNPGTRTIHLAGSNPQNMLSTLLHEVQHGVQDIEGFPSGGDLELPADFAVREKNNRARVIAFEQLMRETHPYLPPEDRYLIGDALRGYSSPGADRALARLHPALREEFHPISQESMALRYQSDKAYGNYHRLAGEVESRAVQEQLERRDWDTPIWQHEGYVPFENQIVRLGGDSPALSFTGYHGTPHAFEKFSNEAIGSGFGGQFRGWGHHVSESREVAGEYRPPAGGHLLDINVVPDKENFLDWGKPIAEQTPQVRKAIEAFEDKMYAAGRAAEPGADFLRRHGTLTGEDYYRDVMKAFHDPNDKSVNAAAEASKALGESGIPGTKYLDPDSPKGQARPYNYVVFDPSHLEIRSPSGQKLAPVDHDPFAGVPRSLADELTEYITELDRRGAKDAEYRARLSTMSKQPLKRGETWRDRLIRWRDYELRKQPRLTPVDHDPFFGDKPPL